MRIIMLANGASGQLSRTKQNMRRVNCNRSEIRIILRARASGDIEALILRIGVKAKVVWDQISFFQNQKKKNTNKKRKKQTTTRSYSKPPYVGRIDFRI